MERIIPNIIGMTTNASGLYIFNGMPQEEVSYFIMMAETVSYKSGEVIIYEGEESDGNAYFIKEGEVSVYRGEHYKIAELGSENVFGEIALITNEPRTATVKAKTDVELVIFHRDEFMLLLKRSEKGDDIRKEIMRRIKQNFTMDKEGGQ